jgi:hypothetical protein
MLRQIIIRERPASCQCPCRFVRVKKSLGIGQEFGILELNGPATGGTGPKVGMKGQGISGLGPEQVPPVGRDHDKQALITYRGGSL